MAGGQEASQASGRLILRNTFIEVEDDTGMNCLLGRARASSDGCLFESSRAEEEEQDRPVDLNVELELTGASCLNTPRSDVLDNPSPKGGAPVSPLAHLQLHEAPGVQRDLGVMDAIGSAACSASVKKEDLQRLSDEVAQLVKQNKQLRNQISFNKEPEAQEASAPWMTFVSVPGCEAMGIQGYVMDNREADLTYSPAWTDQSTTADGGTSVMLRNLPNNYTRSKLLEMLDNEGFFGQYNFVYLPIDFQTEASLGYAFVNMVDSSYVPKLQERLTGFKKWRVPSKKICEVRLCGPWPDLEAHIERYRNSSVMHQSVPEDFKPALFEHGKQIPFPKPSKAPKAPQLRRAPGPVGVPSGRAGGGSNALSPGLVQRSN